MTQDQQDSQQASFLSGFTLGLFAGATGYFLFGTKRGAQLRQQLVEDWEDAKHHLAEEGVIERSDISLREFVKELVNQAVSHTTEIEQQLLPEENGRKTVRTVNRKKETSKRFKGV